MSTFSQEVELELADDFNALARVLHSDGGTAATLDAICRLAVDVLDPAQHAAVTVVRAGRFSTVATSSEVPPHVDRIQYETGQGPCVDSALESETVHSSDLLDESRWPAFVAQVTARTGIRSMLSFRLFARDDVLAALNLYSPEPDAFDERVRGVGAVFAAHAALAYQSARDQERVANLEVALISNRRIGMAIGILMAVRKLTDDQAFSALRSRSQQTHRKLADIAEDVLFTGDLP